MEYKVTFSHGYYPVRLGDCVLLNYKAAGINNVKAKYIRLYFNAGYSARWVELNEIQIMKQAITCDTGCKVTETAIYTSKLWR